MIANLLKAVSILSLVLTHQIAFAVDETKLISSAEKLIEELRSMVGRGYYPLYQEPASKKWKVFKISYVNGSESYDITKTDSIVSPYILKINFRVIFHGSNSNSPNATGPYIESLKAKILFTNREDALKNVKDIDFTEINDQGKRVAAKPYARELRCDYGLQSRNWVLKGGNDSFMTFFGYPSQFSENSKYLKNLLSFPVE